MIVCIFCYPLTLLPTSLDKLGLWGCLALGIHTLLGLREEEGKVPIALVLASKATYKIDFFKKQIKYVPFKIYRSWPICF